MIPGDAASTKALNSQGSVDLEVEENVVDLSVSESTVESWAVLEVRGEVDVHSAPELLKRLTKVLDSGSKSVIVDLNGLAGAELMAGQELRLP